MNDVERGEVVHRSPQLCTGYWGDPEGTEDAFRGGWFHSGDVVRIDEDGYLFVVDRIKDVINTGVPKTCMWSAICPRTRPASC